MDTGPHIGTRLPPLPAAGAVKMFGTNLYRNTILAAVNAILNLRVLIRGTNGQSSEAEVKMTSLGMTVIVPIPPGLDPQTNGKVVYFKLCREDGTTCYVPLSVEGTIYALPGSGVVTPTIDAGAVPTGSQELT
jgi:hypothetical protein